jgi:cyclopropane-fatty-acyl-phospholipid synthase
MSPATLAARVARPAILRALEAWEVGRLTVHLPDGSLRRYGRADAEPSVSLFVDREEVFSKFALRGDMGAGESYMDGDWRADDLTRFLTLALLNRRHLPLDTALTKVMNLGKDLFHRLRPNTRRGSQHNIRAHYDLSNEFFSLFLDESLTYSCALFDSLDQPLAEAQRNKHRRIAEKAQIGPGDHVLEIGCGWGGFAIYAARSNGCRVTGITVSERQLELARQRVQAAGLSDRIDIQLHDYRDVQGRFNRVVSIEMFESLGLENWPTFFRRIEDLLADDGIAVIQTISIPDHRFEDYNRHTDWLQRYIFPGGVLASVHHLTGAMAQSSRLIVGDLEDIGIHYAPTLRLWREAFLARRAEVRALGFDERFVRMWEYYLAVCEATFGTRTLGDLQLVLTRPCNLALPGIPARRAKAA